MPMQFEELDEVTRQHMLEEFENEESGGKPYRAKVLTTAGHLEFPGLMRQAIQTGTESTLIPALLKPEYWSPLDKLGRKVNLHQAAERLGLTEFNTWYVRGLAKRLIEEGVANCQAYRAAAPKWEPAECSQHEGQIFSVQEIYDGHRRRYWPEPGDPSVVSIPFGPGCHHTIRRIQKK